MTMKNLSYPQKYHDNLQKQAAFFNACDYLYYGYGKKTWIKNKHNLGLSEKDSNEVWHEAFVHMANQN